MGNIFAQVRLVAQSPLPNSKEGSRAVCKAASCHRIPQREGRRRILSSKLRFGWRRRFLGTELCLVLGTECANLKEECSSLGFKHQTNPRQHFANGFLCKSLGQYKIVTYWVRCLAVFQGCLLSALLAFERWQTGAFCLHLRSFQKLDAREHLNSRTNLSNWGTADFIVPVEY